MWCLFLCLIRSLEEMQLLSSELIFLFRLRMNVVVRKSKRMLIIFRQRFLRFVNEEEREKF